MQITRLNSGVLALCAVLAAGLATSAEANGDGYDAGRYGAVRLRELIHGQAVVPVPAPVPVPDIKRWYIGTGIGYAVSSSGDITTRGPDIGIFSSFKDVNGPTHVSFAVGRYLANNLRGEFTIEYRPTSRLGKTNRVSYTATKTVQAENLLISDGLGNTLTTQSWDIHTFAMQRDEESRSGNELAVASLYYDFGKFSSFTPYVGAGLGFVVRDSKRKVNESGECTGTVQTYVDPFFFTQNFQPRAACNTLTTATTVSSRAGINDLGIGIAGSLMAGLAYEFTSGITMDLGYRFLWQNAGASINVPSPIGLDGRIVFDTRIDHEIRAALRFDLN